MRETRNGQPRRNVDDAVIDAVAGALMRHEPATGFGRRVVTRLDEVTQPGSGLDGLGLWIRVAAAGVLLAVVASLWPAGSPRRAPEPSQRTVATRAASPATPAPRAQEAAAASLPPTPHAPAAAVARKARGPSRADRLWASRGAPDVERVVVTPVPQPVPVTIEALEVAAISVDGLALEPLAIEALDFGTDNAPNDRER